MSISDEDTDAGSDFIELQPVDKYKENKENIELGIDLTHYIIIHQIILIT
jgi:hypothetical protein